MTTRPADALAAEGAPITVNHPEHGPTIVNVRYTFASLRVIEKKFGNLARLMAVFTKSAEGLEASLAVVQGSATPEQIAADAALDEGSASLFETIVDALAPGLLDEEWQDRRGNDIYLGESPDDLARAMMFDHLTEYVAAFSTAFAQSFKDMHGAGDGGSSNPPAAAPGNKSSRGPRGGASSSAKAGTPRKSSGA